MFGGATANIWEKNVETKKYATHASLRNTSSCFGDVRGFRSALPEGTSWEAAWSQVWCGQSPFRFDLIVLGLHADFEAEISFLSRPLFF